MTMRDLDREAIRLMTECALRPGDRVRSIIHSSIHGTVKNIKIINGTQYVCLRTEDGRNLSYCPEELEWDQ